MKLIYISHPYSGQEVKNRSNAGKIAAELTKKAPHILFINPLDAMRHLKTADASYEDILEKCKALMEKCDGIIMAGDWKNSYGCMAEYEHAQEQNMTVWESIDEFEQDEIMPHDCCGTHSECQKCMCRQCVHRCSCWNCNDCTDVPGAKPIGFTGCGAWECSRYQKKI